MCEMKGVAVKEGVDECGGCELFDEFVTKVSRDGLPSTSDVAVFHKGQEELWRVVKAVLSKAGHGGAVTGHEAVASELTVHGAAHGVVV
jgi:hypothetical protein